MQEAGGWEHKLRKAEKRGQRMRISPAAGKIKILALWCICVGFAGVQVCRDNAVVLCHPPTTPMRPKICLPALEEKSISNFICPAHFLLPFFLGGGYFHCVFSPIVILNLSIVCMFLLSYALHHRFDSLRPRSQPHWPGIVQWDFWEDEIGTAAFGFTHLSWE